MAARKKKRPWSTDLKMPGLLDEPPSPPPKPLPFTPGLGHTTSAFDLDPKKPELKPKR